MKNNITITKMKCYPKIIQIVFKPNTDMFHEAMFGLDDFGQMWQYNDITEEWIKEGPTLEEQLSKK